MFTPNQDEAASHGGGPAVAIAEAGSGKTTVLAERCRRLISTGTPPDDIWMVTFANKNVGDFRAKLDPLCAGVHVMTFHALANRILDKPVLVGLASLLGPEDEEVDLQALDAFIARASGQGQVPELDVLPPAARRVFAQAEGALVTVWAQCERVRRRRGVHTFDSMMAGSLMRLLCEPDVREMWQNRSRAILADEYQDANLVQATLLDLLAQGHRNLMVVGDPKQAIYAWRGAETRFLEEFAVRYPDATPYSLPDNFRCKGEVLASAREVHPDSQLSLTRGFGGALEVVPEAGLGDALAGAARTVGPTDVAVLVRTYAQSTALEVALLERGLALNLEGKVPFFYRGSARVLTSACAVLAQADDASRNRKLALGLKALGLGAPQGLLGGATLRELATGELAAFLEAFSSAVADEGPQGAVRLLGALQAHFALRCDDASRGLFKVAAGRSVGELLEALREHRSPDGVTLTSVHKAKGREWEVVCVPNLERFAPGARTTEAREERNLLFVALTRAKSHLILSGAGETPYLHLGGTRARDQGDRVRTLLSQDDLTVGEALEVAELVQMMGLKRYVERYFERRDTVSVRVRQALAAAAWSPKRHRVERSSPYWEGLTPGQPEVHLRDIVGAWLN